MGLQGVGKRYRWGGRWVLAEVSVELRAGQIVDLKGANGSGKSTLLRLLAGASSPTRGVRLSAEGLTVGFAPESVPPPPLSACQYLDHHARLRESWTGRGRDQAMGGVAALAERLACGHLLDEKMAALSKGSLKKVMVIQALLGDPQLLVLDEAFDGLDEDAQQSLSQIVAERREQGAAIVLSDHRRGESSGGADAVWRVDAGSVAEGAPQR